MSSPDKPNAKPVRSVPLQPHMRKAAIDFLQERLKAARCYVEYGSGGSTRMAVRMKVPVVFSVESDLVFAEAVKLSVAADIAEVGASTRFELLAVDIGSRHRRWGYPDGMEYVPHWPEYPFRLWDAIGAAGLAPDLILVDGRFRVACILASLVRAAPGTTLLVDDYGDRKEWYGAVERHVQPERIVGGMAVFTRPPELDLGALAFELARHCVDPR